ncbi:hypothetical protein CN572_08340 [Bacillus wiedmannii]|uniref:phage tail protein n=1 Tax=Bacillus wiedmannii TaxID=1890302 RepID=UPI000BEF46FD|nr:phage tail protein [Bacillus wiedmannii]PEO73455.1 hypothetical protein CN572_08340 [Bacillus wiedmannii]
MKRVERPKIEQLSTGEQFHLVDMNLFEVIEGKSEPSSIRFEVPDTENNKRVFGYVEDRNLLVFEGQYYILLVNKLNELGFKDCDAIQIGAELSRQTQEQKITGYLSIEEGFAHIFKGSNFKYINQCSPKNQLHFENFGGANRMSMIQNLIKRYDIECIFDNMTVIFADRIGKTTDKLYKFGYNVNAIEKTTDDSDCSFSVLLLGHTPSEEEGGGEQFQYYYESPLKYQMPELIRHRQAENIEDDKIKDEETALRRCKEVVNDIPIVSITVDHKEASFDDTNEPKVGDKAILQHHKYNMDFDVRVVKRRRYPFEQTPNVYEFSNKRDELVDRTEEQKKWTSDILSVVKELDKKLLEQSNDYSDRLNKITEEKVEDVKKESEAAKELAELVKENQKNFQTTIVESKVPPTDHLEPGKSLWLDISKGKPGILKKWNGKTWEPIIADVEAIKNETLQQVNEDIKTTRQDLDKKVEKLQTDIETSVNTEIREVQTNLSEKVAAVKKDTETISGEILNIQKDINSKVDSNFVKEQIKDKADKSGVFTKDEINNGFVGKQIYETDKQGNVKKFQEINTSVEQTNESIKHLATKESVTDLGNNLTQVSKVANEAKQTADGNTRTISQVDSKVNQTATDFDKKTTAIEETVNGVSTKVTNIQTEQGKISERVTKSEQTADGFKTSIESLTKKDTDISNKLNTVETTVEGTKKAISDVQSDTSALKKTTTEITEQAGKISEKLGSVEQKANTLSADFTKKTTEIDKSIEGVKTSVSNVQNEQGKLTERVTKSEQTADGFKTSIESLTKKDTDISNKLNTVESTVEGTKKTISDVQSDTSALKKTTTEMKEQAGKISEKLTSVETKVNNDKAGGRNLLLDSDVKYEKNDYLINPYMLSENFSVGEEYTFVIKGSVPQGQKFGIWQNGGSNNAGYATNVYANGVTYVTFKAVATTSGNERKLTLYNFPSNTTKAVVEWVALYKGNKPQDWTPAPENQVTNAEFTKKATEIEKSVEGVKTTVTGVQNSQSGFEKRMTSVEQTASGLSNSVSQLGQTTTNQGKQITDANSKLDQQAKLIEAKVNIKQVEDYVGGFQIPALKNTVDKNREEALKQIADKVATANYNKKTTEIDNRLKINEEGIGLSAKKTEVYTRVEANGTFATTAYVKTMEARIDVAERNINLSVKEGNVIAAINISKETIQLDAKRINLRGAVTAESIAGKLLEGVTIRAVDPNDRNKKAEMNASGNIFTEAIVKPTVENNGTSKYVTGLRAGELYSETYDESGKREYQMYTTAQGAYFSTGNDNSSYHASGFAVRDNGQNKSVTAVAYSRDEGWRPVLACNNPTENEYGVFKSNGLKFVKYGSYQNQWVNEGNKSFISLYKSRLSSDDGWWGYLQIKSGDDKSHSGVVATEYKTTSQRKMKTFIKDLQFDALQDVLGLKIKEYYFKSDINTLYKMREQRVEGQTPYTLNDIPKYYGFMVDDCPISFTDTDRKGVNLYASLSVTIKGFQQYVVKTDERLNEMEKVINNENRSATRNLRKSGRRAIKRSQSREKHLSSKNHRTRSGK